MNAKRARFEEQVVPHLDAAYRFARWLAHAPQDADDVVQDAMLRAFRAFDALRGSDAKAWLLTIVRNCHFTAVKQGQRRAWVPLPDEADLQDGHTLIEGTPGPEQICIQDDHRKTLEDLLAALPGEHRNVLMLREIEELSYAQIAAVLEIPIGTVMSRLARARAILRSNGLRNSAGEPRAMR